MSIASEITRLQGAKNTLKTKLNAKNDAQHQIDDETLDEYGDFVDSIPTGGGGGAVEENDVNFYDYDGTLLHSYTKTDFLALTEMPENPTHTGLVAQGWNWDLTDAKDYVTDYGILDVGQMYVTDDGKTRIYITLYKGRLSPYCGFAINGTAIIDWGDNSTSDTVTGTSTTTIIPTQHTYATAGDYVISISSSDEVHFIGTASAGSFVLSNNLSSDYNANKKYQYLVNKIELGSNVSIDSNAFQSLGNLEYISIPDNTKFTGATTNNSFNSCTNLKCIIIPKSNNNSIESPVFNVCYGLSVISTSKGTKYTSDYLFQNCYLLKRASFNVNGTQIKQNMFSGCRSLRSITISSTVTRLKSSSFASCYSLAYIKMLGNINYIESNTFDSCYSACVYDFTKNTSVPTLSSTNAFYSIPSDCKIVVPNSLYDTWIAASNWTTYASQIVKESDYNAS